MDDALIERAVDAALEDVHYLDDALKGDWPLAMVRAFAKAAVTAALAEVEADIRAGALRDAAVDIGMGETGEWLRAEANLIEREGKA